MIFSEIPLSIGTHDDEAKRLGRGSSEVRRLPILLSPLSPTMAQRKEIRCQPWQAIHPTARSSNRPRRLSETESHRRFAHHDALASQVHRPAVKTQAATWQAHFCDSGF